MSEYFKFTVKDNCILLNNEVWAICKDKQNARKIVTALKDMQRGGIRLDKENERLRQEIKDLKSSDEAIKWARENTVWEIMPTNRRTYTETSYKE